MLKVPCGVSGKVRIVKENSITGEVTHDSEFSNIWTDYGLGYLSGYATKNVHWPNHILYGSGTHAEPHNGVTSLKTFVGLNSAGYANEPRNIKITSEACIATVTRSIVVPKRGVAWVLSELALGYHTDRKTLTYTLTKNIEGVPTPVQVSDIEIVTIYYTMQLVYPMELPPQNIEVVGLPPTTATFKLKPLGSPNTEYFLSYITTGRDYTMGFTSEAFGGGVRSNEAVGNARRFGIGSLNRSTEFFGSYRDGVNHIWKLDPPIVKNNTQILDIEEYWQFSNVTPIEIPK